MKRYIILSYDIHPLGGCQNYLSGKCPYLESKGYDVYILYAGISSPKFEFKNLAKYSNGNIPELDFIPAEIPRFLKNCILLTMKSIVTKCDRVYDETIIESHYDKMHLWGELLAEKISAKHMCFNCNEIFRGKGKYYEQYLDFYKYKLNRKELYGITKNSMSFLFGNNININVQSSRTFEAAHPKVVQDVDNYDDSIIPYSDWSICYIGRILKNYVDEILSNVALFSHKHKEKKINFIIIGDAQPKIEKINSIFNQISNVNLIILGNLVPIPRAIIKKMDVILAGAGSAYCVLNEGVPVIVPDSNTCLSNGLLCYENISAVFLDKGRQHETFEHSLERVLVQKVHTTLKVKFKYTESSVSDVYDEHMSMIADSEKQRNYYPHDDIVNGSYSFIHKIKVVLAIFKRKWL